MKLKSNPNIELTGHQIHPVVFINFFNKYSEDMMKQASFIIQSLLKIEGTKECEDFTDELVNITRETLKEENVQGLTLKVYQNLVKESEKMYKGLELN